MQRFVNQQVDAQGRYSGCIRDVQRFEPNTRSRLFLSGAGSLPMLVSAPVPGRGTPPATLASSFRYHPSFSTLRPLHSQPQAPPLLSLPYRLWCACHRPLPQLKHTRSTAPRGWTALQMVAAKTTLLREVRVDIADRYGVEVCPLDIAKLELRRSAAGGSAGHSQAEEEFLRPKWRRSGRFSCYSLRI